MEPRVLPFSPSKKKEKPLREFCILLPNGKTFEQKAHDFSEITMESEDATATLCLAFYIDQQRVLALPYNPEMVIMDKAHTDVTAVMAAYKKPKRIKRAAKE
jgi:hypothetical protein